MGIDAGGAVFGIREVEYGTPFGRVFLGNDPNGVHLQVREGRGAERPRCVAQDNLFKHGLIFAQERFKYSLGALGPE